MTDSTDLRHGPWLPIGKRAPLTEPKPPANDTERTPQGIQRLVPGVRPITDRDRAEFKGRQPLCGKKTQRPADFGLFDDGARRQADLADFL